MQVLHRFKPCSRRVGGSWWWGSLTMVPAGNKANHFLSVNHTTKTIHHHHHSRTLFIIYIFSLNGFRLELWEGFYYFTLISNLYFYSPTTHSTKLHFFYIAWDGIISYYIAYGLKADCLNHVGFLIIYHI